MNANPADGGTRNPVDSNIRAGEPAGGTPAPAATPVPPSLTAWQRFTLIFKVAEVRLRFVAILVVVGLCVGYWDAITNHWEKETRPGGAIYNAVRESLGEQTAQRIWPRTEGTLVASNTEYYCPMHPQVVRRSLEPDGRVPKCPICGMPLSLRKRGETPKLPEGVLSRKQYSPEQIQAAGIKTVAAAYRTLEKEITTVGFVTYDESRRARIAVRSAGYLEKLYVDKPWITVKKGEPLGEIYSPELYSAARELLIAVERGASSELARSAREKLRLLGIGDREIDEIVSTRKANHRLVLRAPISGHLIRKEVVAGTHVEAGQTLFEIADLSRIWIEAEVYEADIEFLRAGQKIEATFEAYPGRVFTANISLVHPHMDAATRTNAVRFEVENPGHELRPGMFATVRIKTPLAEIEPFRTLMAQAVSASESVRGTHVPTARPGEVLAVPERSVIDTGQKKIVYVEREPGLFDGVEVELGPRVDEFYPVIRGLQAGDRIAERGAFLVDAETRLNPAAASTYIGAGGGPHAGTPASSPQDSSEGHHAHDASPGPLTKQQGQPPAEADRRNVARLEPVDRDLALAQGICPISGEPLGSMGVPYKITLKNRSVFLCCEGCVGQARREPEKTLAKIDEIKRR